MKDKLWIILIYFLFCTGCSVNQGDKRLENAVGSSNAENFSLSNSRAVLPAADVLSVALTLKRQGKELPVNESEIFKEKDALRLNISMVKKGYLLILYKGSDGEAEVIFPNKEFYYGSSEVEPNKNIVIPAKGWFFFDEKQGIETIFIIFFETKDSVGKETNIEKIIRSIERTQAEKNNADAFIDENGSFVRVLKLSHQ